MAFDAFLEIDGIDGESTNDKHKGEIEISSFSWGVSNPSSVGSGGLSQGRANFQDLHFTAHASKATPKLFLACASGKHITSATLTERRVTTDDTSVPAVQKSFEFLKWKFTDCLVSSFQESADSGDSPPLDSFSFNYAKIEMTYSLPPSADGSVPPPVTAFFDRRGNKFG